MIRPAWLKEQVIPVAGWYSIFKSAEDLGWP
jgi:hypothetical protein